MGTEINVALSKIYTSGERKSAYTYGNVEKLFNNSYCTLYTLHPHWYSMYIVIQTEYLLKLNPFKIVDD